MSMWALTRIIPLRFGDICDEHLTKRVSLREFNEIDGNAPDLESFCAAYARDCAKAILGFVY